MSDRAGLLSAVRRALGRGELGVDERRELDARIASAESGPIPTRAQGERRELIDRFIAMAEEASATVRRVAAPGEVPAAVGDYLAAHNLPSRLRVAPDPAVADLPWRGQPMIDISVGAARAEDSASLTPALAGVAETGTLALVSGPGTPTTLNLLPDAHIVLLRAGDIVGSLEEVWTRLRRLGALPRTVNFITGPSRSADIEQTLQMGAHGPRRLHILLIDE